MWPKIRCGQNDVQKILSVTTNKINVTFNFLFTVKVLKDAEIPNNAGNRSIHPSIHSDLWQTMKNWTLINSDNDVLE